MLWDCGLQSCLALPFLLVLFWLFYCLSCRATELFFSSCGLVAAYICNSFILSGILIISRRVGSIALLDIYMYMCVHSFLFYDCSALCQRRVAHFDSGNPGIYLLISFNGFLTIAFYYNCRCLFPVCCLGQDVEFDCIGSWSSPSYQLHCVSWFVKI